jgi:Leucine-rich repeat (LRR) protein
MNKFSATVYFLLLLLGGYQILSAQVNEQDSLALVALYDSTDGENWVNSTNWLTGDVSDWFGVTVSDGRVTELSLFNNNMIGTLPPKIGDLTGMQILSIGLSQISGSIPPEIGNLTNLTVLNLQQNFLTGTIPAEVGNLVNLMTCRLQGNQLNGSIPPKLGDLIKLESLYLNGNLLTGNLPDEIANLVNLKTLTVFGNQLTGEIPDGLWNLVNLETLNLSNNLFVGTIPPEIKNLVKLTELSIGRNQLNGNIPTEIGDLVNLWYLFLASNNHSGTIPEEIGNLENLEVLYLSGNDLSGSLPSAIGNLIKLVTLHLGGNQLSGAIPEEFYHLIHLRSLRLSSNQFSDTISSKIADFTELNDLRIEDNMFFGALPEELNELSALEYAYLQDNDFEVLPDLAADTSLTELIIWNNRFTFEDIEPNMFVTYFYYTPQDSIGQKIDTTVSPGSSIEFSISVGGTANQYQWIKDGLDIEGANSSAYLLEDINEEDTGSYTCKITNTIATELTLYSRPINVVLSSASGLSDHSNMIPKDFVLDQNYPNPFNPSTMIHYQLPLISDVRLAVYNVLGQKIITLVSERQEAGHYQVQWDAGKVSNGIYYYHFQAGDYHDLKKMVFIK